MRSRLEEWASSPSSSLPFPPVLPAPPSERPPATCFLPVYPHTSNLILVSTSLLRGLN